MVAVIMIGVGTALAAPYAAVSPEEATMVSDLNRIAAAQEKYFDSHEETYTPKLSELKIVPSPDVTIELRAEGASWNAVATHAKSKKKCAIYIYMDAVVFAEHPIEARQEGVPGCA